MSVVNIEDIEDLPNRPDVLLIDVRDPPEIKSTGSIPTSINIPCMCAVETICFFDVYFYYSKMCNTIKFVMYPLLILQWAHWKKH